jgi:DNA-binding LacI/PurR family transcriptional regulator
MKKATVHSRLLAYLQAIIDRSEVGAQLPSIRAIHAEFRCSHATIDKALSDLERQGRIERRSGRGIFVAAPERRIILERDQKRRNGTVVFAYPDYPSHEYMVCVQQAELQAVRRGCNLVTLKMRVDTSYDYLFERLERTEDVKGLLILPSGQAFEEQVCRRLAGVMPPAVVLWPREHPTPGSGLCHVWPDHADSGRQMVARLLDRGCRSLAYVHNEPDTAISALRYAGLKRGLYEGGRKLKDLIRTEQRCAPWCDSALTAYEATRSLLLRRQLPDGCIYDSLRGAIAGIRALREAEVAVPGALAVIAEGGDGINAWLHPRITSTEWDIPAMLERAFDRIEAGGGEDVLLPFELFARETG